MLDRTRMVRKARKESVFFQNDNVEFIFLSL